jgi:hypothetical protein
MSRENMLLIAHQGERFDTFWKYAEEDQEDAPPAIQALIAGQDPLAVTQEEADEVLSWCRGRIGCMPLTGGLSRPGDAEWPVEALPRGSQHPTAGNRRRPA